MLTDHHTHLRPDDDPARFRVEGTELVLLDGPQAMPWYGDGAMERLIRRIRASGVTVLLIEHVMSALMTLSDRVMIMNHGAKLYEGSPAEVASDAEVVRVYLGTDAGDLLYDRNHFAQSLVADGVSYRLARCVGARMALDDGIVAIEWGDRDPTDAQSIQYIQRLRALI